MWTLAATKNPKKSAVCSDYISYGDVGDIPSRWGVDYNKETY